MEKLIKVLYIGSYFLMILGTFRMVLGALIQYWYDRSNDKLLDHMKGYEVDYISHVRRGFVMLIIGIVIYFGTR